MDVDGVRELIRVRLADYESMRAMARAWKVSAPYLSDVLRGRRDPGPRILKRLGLRAERRTTVTYHRVVSDAK